MVTVRIADINKVNCRVNSYKKIFDTAGEALDYLVRDNGFCRVSFDAFTKPSNNDGIKYTEAIIE